MRHHLTSRLKTFFFCLFACNCAGNPLLRHGSLGDYSPTSTFPPRVHTALSRKGVFLSFAERVCNPPSRGGPTRAWLPSPKATGIWRLCPSRLGAWHGGLLPLVCIHILGYRSLHDGWTKRGWDRVIWVNAGFCSQHATSSWQDAKISLELVWIYKINVYWVNQWIGCLVFFCVCVFVCLSPSLQIDELRRHMAKVACLSSGSSFEDVLPSSAKASQSPKHLKEQP